MCPCSMAAQSRSRSTCRPCRRRLSHAGAQAIVSSPTINVTVNGSAGTPQQNQDLADKIGRHMKDQAQVLVAQELRREMRPGGLIAFAR